MRTGRPPKGGPRSEWWREYYAKNRKRILQKHKERADWKAKKAAYQRDRRAAAASRREEPAANPLLNGFRA